jgi:hypothetical protein
MRHCATIVASHSPPTHLQSKQCSNLQLDRAGRADLPHWLTCWAVPQLHHIANIGMNLEQPKVPLALLSSSYTSFMHDPSACSMPTPTMPFGLAVTYWLVLQLPVSCGLWRTARACTPVSDCRCLCRQQQIYHQHRDWCCRRPDGRA